ncbi:MAG: bacillithiol biosynthesis deacetylase BshB2 [Clostridia bacterium]|nr:bacillithiol biosynthesis deacetylase BshB2 [Clostridia bacterium]
MQAIEADRVRAALAAFCGEPVYVHVETTNGAYAKHPFGMFGRNLVLRAEEAALAGQGPYRAALALAGEPGLGPSGWLYVEGLTHWEEGEGRLFLAGYDDRNRLTVSLELGRAPFPLGTGDAPDAKGARPRIERIAVPLDPALVPEEGRSGAPRAVGPADPRGRAARRADRRPDPARERALLVVLPHPDDECFGVGGTIALHAANGVPVTYLCLTSGQMGRQMGDPPVANRETLGAVREEELVRSCRALGIRDLRLLRVWDKTVEFRDPEWLVQAVLSVMRDVRPSLVLTFHPVEGGHPDHCAAGAATREAALRFAAELRRSGDADLVPRLVYPVGFRARAQVGLSRITYPIAEYADRKRASREAHHSQTSAWARRPSAPSRRLRARWERALREESFWVEAV